MDSSSSTKKNTKLSVKNQICFKKSSFSSNNIPPARKKINLSMREKTLFNKAYELTTLCDIQVCVIYYGCDGELIKIWPDDDEHKVREMAERFTILNEKERRKKSTNLTQFLNKKILSDNKFSEKVSDLENSLVNRLRIFQAKLLRLLNPENQTEHDDQSRAFSSDLFKTIEDPPHHQPLMNHKSDDEYRYTGGDFTTDLLIGDPNQQSLMGGVSTTEQNLSTSSLCQQQNKFSIFLYNHVNGSFCQLPDSVSCFDQASTPYNNLSTALLGPQGFGLKSNNIGIPMAIPPQIQTQNPLLCIDQFAAWNQTSSFADPMMFSSSN